LAIKFQEGQILKNEKGRMKAKYFVKFVKITRLKVRVSQDIASFDQIFPNRP